MCNDNKGPLEGVTHLEDAIIKIAITCAKFVFPAKITNTIMNIEASTFTFTFPGFGDQCRSSCILLQENEIRTLSFETIPLIWITPTICSPFGNIVSHLTNCEIERVWLHSFVPLREKVI